VETKDHYKERQRKKLKRLLGSDKSTPSLGRGPPYKESNDSTSTTDDDNGGDRGSQYHIAPSGGGTQFTGEKHKLCYICVPYFFTDH
jgi:hypothetical protein